MNLPDSTVALLLYQTVEAFIAGRYDDFARGSEALRAALPPDLVPRRAYVPTPVTTKGVRKPICHHCGKAHNRWNPRCAKSK